MKYGFSFLMIVMAFPSCNQSSSSNHGVEYHPLLVEIADTYCSIYAEPAELAIDIMDLRAEHHDALSSGDLSCTERIVNLLIQGSKVALRPSYLVRKRMDALAFDFA